MRNKGGLRLTRWVDAHLLEAMEQRGRSRPEVMQQRKQLVAHPFGTMQAFLFCVRIVLSLLGYATCLTVASPTKNRAWHHATEPRYLSRE